MGSSNCNNTTEVSYDIAQINSFDKTRSDTCSTVMTIGCNSNKFIYRVLLRFNLDCLPKNVQILKATLVFKVTNTAPKCSRHLLYGYTINSNWNINTICWNNQPSINYSNKILNHCVNSEECYSFDLTKEAITWHKYPNLNYGMILICCDETSYNKIQILINNESCCDLKLFLHYNIDNEVHVIVEPSQFFQYPEDIVVSEGIETYTSTRDVSLSRNVSYFIKNNSTTSINVVFEYSPDSINFMKEDRILSIPAGSNSILFPIWFSKYIRLAIVLSPGGNTATINTWLQIQQ